MKPCIVIIEDTAIAARCLDCYLRSSFGNEGETYFITYERRSIGLTGELYRRADIFVVGLMRRYDFGLRAEGIFVAETLWKNRKRALIVSGCAKAHSINSPIFWDLSADIVLPRQIEFVLNLDEKADLRLDALHHLFAPYCRKLPNHRSRKDTQ